VNSSYIETIKAVDGEIFHIDYHQERYQRVLSSFGIDEFKNLSEFLTPPKWGIYRCRVVYDSTNICVSYHEYKKRDIKKIKIVFDNNIDYALKSTNREGIDSLFTQKDDADEILIIKNLLVTDTSIANIALFKNGVWFTPKNPLLKGTTRARLLSVGKIVEADIRVQELRSFSKVALLNAMIDFDILERFEFLI